MDHRAHALTPGKPGARPARGPRLAAVRLRNLVLLGFGLLVLAELSFFAWILVDPLPNANNLDTPTRVPVRRGWLLLKLFPEIVPDTSYRDSLLGNGIRELSHVENLPQRVPIVLAAGLIAAAAIGLGDSVLRALKLERGLGLGERTALDYGLGAGLLGVVTLLAGRAGWLEPWSFRIGLGLIAAVGLGASRLWRAGLPELSPWSPLGLVIAPFVAIILLGSMLPTIDFDVLEYHLQGPKEYFQAGRIGFLPHNVYTNMPFGVEMLHLLGMEVLGDWWWGGLAGQLLVALFAPAAAMLIAATALRAGSSRAAWVAAVVYITTPWVYRLGVIAYVEGPLCYYHAALIWAAIRRRDGSIPDRRAWWLLGLLAGCAMGCKYPALISAVLPFGVLALVDSWKGRSVLPVLCYVAGWSILMGPWLGKNVVDTGDPVYPLGYRVFHGRGWDEARERKWASAHGPKTVTARELWASVVEVAGRSDWQSPLYAMLAPLAMLRPGSCRMSLALWGYVWYIFATWWLLTHRLDRFWLPLLPPLAVLAGLGADAIRHRAWSVFLGILMSLVVVTNLTYISTALAGLNEWTGDLKLLRRDIPRRFNGLLASLDAELPRDARVLLVGQAQVFHLDRLVAYNTVFDRETVEELSRGKSPEQFREALRQRGLTHIYVDWMEIRRHRRPGGYGFTDYVTPERFARWVADGILGLPVRFGTDQELYEVR